MTTTTATTATLFDQLCDQLHAVPDRKGEVWVDCPSCGKDGKHFSFNETTGHCFACDYSGSLRQIAELLGTVDRPAPRAQRPAAPPRPDLWQMQPTRWLERYCAAFDRVQRWQGCSLLLHRPWRVFEQFAGRDLKEIAKAIDSLKIDALNFATH